MALVEERYDAVALLPLGDFGANLNDLTGAVRGGNYREGEGEGVFALLWGVSLRMKRG